MSFEQSAQHELPAAPSSQPQDAACVGSAGPNDEVYGSFWIGETEFALTVKVIQEVVNEPAAYAPVPLSPPHVVGLFNLRSMIVPVIDLRVLLGFPDLETAGKRKVAIIENGDLCLGLLFDDTGGVINGSGAARVIFQPSANGPSDVVIKGVLKLENGARMVQLLDPYELLNIKKLPRVARNANGEVSKNQLGQRLSCITFQLGHTHCAMDLHFVQEIMNVPEIQKSHVAHGHILGNIELRGRTMPVVDFRGMLGNEPPHQFKQDALQSRKLLILNLPDGHIALLVYSIDSILSFYESDVLPFANVALPRHDIVAGCLVNNSNEIVILLDHDKLMRDDGLVNAARSCQEIYPSSQQDTDLAERAANVVRATYVLFTVDMPLAFNISCVSEIINRPDTLLRPPYALNFVDGILNLRGELITLINTRVLYDLPKTDQSARKVIIFHKDDKRYGVVVDSVDEIVTTTTKDLLDVPSINKSGAGRIVSQDVLGCLRLPSEGVDSDPVMVLDAEALIARCVDFESG